MSFRPVISQEAPRKTRQQILAEQLMAEGSDTSPIQSPWQGVARLAKGALGGYQQAKLEQGEKTRQQALADALGAADRSQAGGETKLAGGESIKWNVATPEQSSRVLSSALAANPETADVAMDMQMGRVKQRQALADAIAEKEALMPYEIKLAREKAKGQGMSGATNLAAMRMMQDDPGLSFTQAYMLASAKQGQGVTVGDNGMLVPIGGAPEAATTMAQAKEAGTQQAKNEFEPIRTGLNQQAEKDVDLAMNPQIAAETDRAKNAVSKEASFPKATAAFEAAKAQNTNVRTKIASVLPRVNTATAGYWATGTPFIKVAEIPGTAAYDLGQDLNTIKANAGFDKLQEMRNNSPTGGALGNVTERELGLLQQTWSNVEQSQSPDQLTRNLQEFDRQQQESWARIEEAYQLDYGGMLNQSVPGAQVPGQAPASPAAGVPAGIDPALFEVMTPEERALFQ